MRPPLVLADDVRRSLDEVSRAHVVAVLQSCQHNQTNAARILGIDRKTLARSLQRWGISTQNQQPRLRPGSLIAIEGIDGAGISTQAKRLVDHLNANGHPAVLTAEPSDGPVGQFVRRLLVAKSALPQASALRTLSLLFAADRIDHFQRTVVPVLSRGTTVVSDRWYHSSFAYQRTGVEREWIAALNRYTRVPDITVVLDVRPEIGQQRRVAAGRAPEYFHDLATQRDVVAGYRATIAELRMGGERIAVVHGEQPEEAVAAEVLSSLGLRAPRS